MEADETEVAITISQVSDVDVQHASSWFDMTIVEITVEVTVVITVTETDTVVVKELAGGCVW